MSPHSKGEQKNKKDQREMWSNTSGGIFVPRGVTATSDWFRFRHRMLAPVLLPIRSQAPGPECLGVPAECLRILAPDGSEHWHQHTMYKPRQPIRCCCYSAWQKYPSRNCACHLSFVLFWYLCLNIKIGDWKWFLVDHFFFKFLFHFPKTEEKYKKWRIKKKCNTKDTNKN